MSYGNICEASVAIGRTAHSLYNEARCTMLLESDPAAAEWLLHHAQDDVNKRWQSYEQLAAVPVAVIGRP